MKRKFTLSVGTRFKIYKVEVDFYKIGQNKNM